MLSMFGKSTRVLFQNIDEVYSHLQDLAHSMRYSQSIECNLTGVYCKMNSIFNVSNLLKEEKDIAKEKSNATIESGDGEDDLVFIRQEQLQFCFTPLNAVFKKDVCQKLNIPYIYNENSSDFQSSKTNMTRPRLEKKIAGDGNCFFRAVSCSLSNSEDFHNVIRAAVCEHMMENNDLFIPFLDGEQCIKNYLSSSEMPQEGTWATEIEIFATAHLLNIDIYTFSRGSWIRFSVDDIEPSVQVRSGSIYLNHQHQNHYNVVLSVHGEESYLTQTQNQNNNEYEKRSRNRTRQSSLLEKQKKISFCRKKEYGCTEKIS